MNELERDQTPCYVARCLCGCGHLVFASVDSGPDRKKENAKEVAKLIRQGYAIERMPVGEVRYAKWFCEKRKKETIP